MSNEKLGKFTFRLMKERRSFSMGFTEVMNLGQVSHKYNIDNSTREADKNALSSDWHAVGQDLSFAMKKYEQGKA